MFPSSIHPVLRIKGHQSSIEQEACSDPRSWILNTVSIKGTMALRNSWSQGWFKENKHFGASTCSESKEVLKARWKLFGVPISNF